MLNDSDAKLLTRAIATNRCVLFLGAGFSAAAKNVLGEDLPAGWDLASSIWTWLGYEAEYGPFDDSPLDRLFDIARKQKGDRAFKGFLDERLLVSSYPDWYKSISYPYWRRIYTTNVDDLVERVFADARTTKLDVLNGINARPRERDQFLERLQYVKLNGSIVDGLDLVTFGARQYARRASEYDVWYDQFVRDYSTHATILVGTKLNEPLFSQALEARRGRHGAASELRLRSFLVADKITPVVLRSLADFNVVPVEAPAEEFFRYLNSLISTIPSPEEMLVAIDPRRADYLSIASRSPEAKDALKEFSTAFSRIEPIDPPRSYRSLFHHGATPDWQDIALGLDARRDVTRRAQDLFEEALSNNSDDRCFVVTDHRGAGKSTLMMRTALNLSASGHVVYYAVGEDVPESHVLVKALDAIDRPVALFIDDAEWVTGRATSLKAALMALRHPPMVVLGIRSSRLMALEGESFSEIWLGDLTDGDIEAVVDVLEAANTLGVMTGQPRTVIHDAFRVRASKQLLVAMKEVTSGREFDDIIRREYAEVEDQELRLTYLIACLATAAGTSLTRTQLLSCSELPPALLLSGLSRELRGLLVHAPDYGDRVIARHPVIALSVVEQSAPKSALSTAYKRILTLLANDMGDKARGSAAKRWFRLYKTLINHAELFRRFERDLEEARSIFDEVMPRLSKDAHFWLQYGSLELESGELDLASRYINTAESLRPDDFVVKTAKGHLLLALARSASSQREAERLRSEGETLLTALIEERGDDSDYPWHVLITHMHHWIGTWVTEPEDKRRELHMLLSRATEACEARPKSVILQRARATVERSYLMLATTSAS